MPFVAPMTWRAASIAFGPSRIIGATNGIEAAPGSVRGDYALEVRRNLVHGSDSRESAEREIEIYFGDEVG